MPIVRQISNAHPGRDNCASYYLLKRATLEQMHGLTTAAASRLVREQVPDNYPRPRFTIPTRTNGSISIAPVHYHNTRTRAKRSVCPPTLHTKRGDHHQKPDKWLLAPVYELSSVQAPSPLRSQRTSPSRVHNSHRGAGVTHYRWQRRYPNEARQDSDCAADSVQTVIGRLVSV
jgi:hypothetical protein